MGRVPQHAVHIQNVQVLSVGYDGAGAHAAVSYQQNGVPQQESVDLVEEGRHLGLYPAWRLVVPAPSLEVALEVPRAGVPVAIDGYPVVTDGQGVASVFVIPGTHRVRLAADGPFSEDLETVDASAAAARVTLRSSLSAAGRSAAQRAVEGFFSGCAAATTLVPDHCPQWESNWTSAPSNVHWALRGDPLAATTLEVDSEGAVEASGSWAMDVAYDAPTCMFCDSSTPPQHLTDTRQGRYRAVLNWTGSAFTVTSVNGETVPSPVPATGDRAGST